MMSSDSERGGIVLVPWLLGALGGEAELPNAFLLSTRRTNTVVEMWRGKCRRWLRTSQVVPNVGHEPRRVLSSTFRSAVG